MSSQMKTTRLFGQSFLKDERLNTTLRFWLKQDQEGKEPSTNSRSRAERAILRRCALPDEILFQESFHRWRAEVEQLGYTIPQAHLRRAACLVGLLSRIEQDSEHSLAALMGTPNDGDAEKPALSGLRFRRLLQVDDDDVDTLFFQLLRVLGILGKRANLSRLAADIFDWGPRVRRQWAEDYYRQTFALNK